MAAIAYPQVTTDHHVNSHKNLDYQTKTQQPYNTQTHTQSHQTQSGTYTTLSSPITIAPPVIVFFSFTSPNSYGWAIDHEVVQSIRRVVPQGTEISRYHAPCRKSWPAFGSDLTHSWSVAKSLGVDDRIIKPLFDAVLVDRRVTDLEGIRAVFDDCGIPPSLFLKEWGKQWVLSHKEAMDEAVEHVEVRNLPCIVVKGKYMIQGDVFGDDFRTDRMVELVKELLERE